MSSGSSSSSAVNATVYGLDIGGTKCAVSVLRGDTVVEVARFATGDFEQTFRQLVDALAPIMQGSSPVFGISCGGPLDA